MKREGSSYLILYVSYVCAKSLLNTQEKCYNVLCMMWEVYGFLQKEQAALCKGDCNEKKDKA